MTLQRYAIIHGDEAMGADDGGEYVLYVDAETEINQLNAELTDAGSKLDTANNDLAEVRAQLASANTRLQEAKDALYTASVDVETLKSRNEALSADNLAKTQTVADALTQVNSLRSACRTAASAIERVLTSA